MTEPAPLIEVRDLVRVFRLPRTSLKAPPERMRALAGISFDVLRGETLGVVGESGSGKSTLARLLVALDSPDSGRILFEGEKVSGMPEKQLKRLRKEVQIVFQDPMGSLDPRMRVGQIILEPFKALAVEGDPQSRLKELLKAVGLEPESARRYPHEFSGGQRQRIAIARALAPRPRLLVADEPSSALDVSVQAQILKLLEDLKSKFDFTLVMISHDLSVIQHMCDRVLVLYRGQIVESGKTGDVFGNPQHSYTQRLIESVPTLDGVMPAMSVSGEDS